VAVLLSELKEYVGLPPDASDAMLKKCLEAAKIKANTAGILAEDHTDDPHYDLFIYGLAGYLYDNRSMAHVGSNPNRAGDDAATRDMINAFVLELRYGGAADG